MLVDDADPEHTAKVKSNLLIAIFTQDKKLKLCKKNIIHDRKPNNKLYLPSFMMIGVKSMMMTWWWLETTVDLSKWLKPS